MAAGVSIGYRPRGNGPPGRWRRVPGSGHGTEPDWPSSAGYKRQKGVCRPWKALSDNRALLTIFMRTACAGRYCLIGSCAILRIIEERLEMPPWP